MSVHRILSWQINSINQERQEVIRSVDGLPAETIATLSATDTGYIDTEDYPMTTGVAYQIASIATIKGVESRVVSETIEMTADGKVIKFTPYTFKSAGTTLSADSLEAFTITTNGTEYPSVFDEATSKWKLTDVVVTTTDDISITSVATPNQYSSVINITTPISEIVNWSSFDWGVNGVLVKPNLTQLIKAPTVAPTTTNLGFLFYNAELFNDSSVSGWDTANVVDFSSVFAGCSNFNQPVTNWNTANAVTLRGLFDRCFVFNQPVNHFVTSNCTDFGYMFNACMVFNQDLSNFDTSNATKMDGMFRLAKLFNYPLNHFVTTHVTTFGTMFGSAFAFNQPLDTWNTSNATNMDSMFSDANKFNQDISGWNVSNVTSMDGMFYYAKAFVGNLSQWCVTNITSEPANFATSAGAFTKPVWGTCPRGENIPANEVHFVTNGAAYYQGIAGDEIVYSDGTTLPITSDQRVALKSITGTQKVVLKSDRGESSLGKVICFEGSGITELLNFPTSNEINGCKFYIASGSANLVKVPTTLPPNITDLSRMFQGCRSFNQDISGWDTTNVVNMSTMFYEAGSFNQPVGGWNIGNVTDLSRVFQFASKFDQDISAWNTSSVTNMSNAFNGAALFNQPLTTWDTSNVTNMRGMFQSATNFNQPLNAWNVSNVTNMSYMFYEASAFNSAIDQWDTSKVTIMDSMFYEATAFNVDISSWNTALVDDMDYMFYGANAFSYSLQDWCVPLITREPSSFGNNDRTFGQLKYPTWGTCPRGENAQP